MTGMGGLGEWMCCRCGAHGYGPPHETCIALKCTKAPSLAVANHTILKALADLHAKLAEPSAASAPSGMAIIMRSGLASFAGLEAGGDVITAPLSLAGTAKARRRERRKAART